MNAVIRCHQTACGSSSLTFCNQFAPAVGMIVNAIMNDAMTATDITSARSANNCPDISLRNIIGRKITTVVAVDASNAPATSVAPIDAASSASTPFSRSRTIFSRTTMAPSRTMPIAKARPAREMIFSVRPVACMTRKAVNKEIGIASATTSVARNFRRNHQRTPIASKIPINRFVRSIAMEFFM